MIVAIERHDLLDQVLRRLRWVAADLEQREHQRGEFVAHRQAGEADADVRAGAADQEAGRAVVIAGGDADLVRQGGDLVEQLAHLVRLGVLPQARDQLHGEADVDQIGFELLRQIGVEHGIFRGL